MIFSLLLPYSSFGLFILRVVIGIIFLYHAFPKLKNFKSMATGIGMPAGMILMLGIVEFVASIGLIVGLYAQFSALLLAIIMLGAIAMKIIRWHVPFAAMDKTGWEFDLILLAGNIAILLGGGGMIRIQ